VAEVHRGLGIGLIVPFRDAAHDDGTPESVAVADSETPQKEAELRKNSPPFRSVAVWYLS
jgi:hypothetical protein